MRGWNTQSTELEHLSAVRGTIQPTSFEYGPITSTRLLYCAFTSWQYEIPFNQNPPNTQTVRSSPNMDTAEYHNKCWTRSSRGAGRLKLSFKDEKLHFKLQVFSINIL